MDVTPVQLVVALGGICQALTSDMRLCCLLLTSGLYVQALWSYNVLRPAWCVTKTKATKLTVAQLLSNHTGYAGGPETPNEVQNIQHFRVCQICNNSQSLSLKSSGARFAKFSHVARKQSLLDPPSGRSIDLCVIIRAQLPNSPYKFSTRAMQNGFALRRNGTCLDQEVSCGPTVSPFNACCPHGSFCLNPYNRVCCQSSANCTDSIVESPSCSDRSWTLYNNGGVASGYFCCLNTSVGYAARANSDGCGDPTYNLRNEEVQLQSITQRVVSTTLTPSANIGSLPTRLGLDLPTDNVATSTGTIFISPTSQPESQSGKMSTGTVIGAVAGIVGGMLLTTVLALWLVHLYRRKRLRTKSSNPDESATAYGPVDIKKHPANRLSNRIGGITSLEMIGQAKCELPASVAVNPMVSPVTKGHRGLAELS